MRTLPTLTTGALPALCLPSARISPFHRYKSCYRCVASSLPLSDASLSITLLFIWLQGLDRLLPLPDALCHSLMRISPFHRYPFGCGYFDRYLPLGCASPLSTAINLATGALHALHLSWTRISPFYHGRSWSTTITRPWRLPPSRQPPLPRQSHLPPGQSPVIIRLLPLFDLAACLAIGVSRMLHLGALRCDVVHLEVEPRLQWPFHPSRHASGRSTRAATPVLPILDC